MLDFEKDSKATVLMKDRDKRVEELRITLVMSGLNLSYHHADLMNTVLDKLLELGDDKFSMKDGNEIQSKWETKWIKYHKDDK